MSLKMSRRNILKGVAASAAAALFAACNGATVPEPTEVNPSVATTAPTTAAPTAVQQPTGRPTAAATSAPQPTEPPTAAPSVASEWPYPFQYGSLSTYQDETGQSITSFQEAPMLAALVKAGDLPPVSERLPEEPVVVQPLESVGVYGGELAGPATNPTAFGWDSLEMRLQKLFTLGPDLISIVPNIAQGYELSDDLRVLTVHLRKGHKWSDGEPFTAEDFRFFFEDVVSNAEITPNPPRIWAPGQELAQFKVIDEYTVSYTFAQPNPQLIVAMATERGDGGYRPAHYLSQFHIKYNPDADKLAKDQGFDTWLQLFLSKVNPYGITGQMGSETDPGQPTLDTFVFVNKDTFGNKYYERNPYFFKVDTAGNQLPYTDGSRRILVENLEVQDLKALAGEYTHYGWGSLLNYSTYKDNADAGGYRTVLVTYERGNEYGLMFNLNHPDPALQEIFADVRFRQAMSLAINRDEINQLVYFGLATPSQASVTPNSAFYESWMTTNYAAYDEAQANELLDAMGLDKRDANGFRLRPDGEPLTINMQVSVPEDAWRKIAELVVSYWNAVKVKANLKMIEVGLYSEIRAAGTHDIAAWGMDVTDVGDYGGSYAHLRPNWGPRYGSNEWSKWLSTGGAEGIEPPEDIKDLWSASELALQKAFGSPEYMEAAADFYQKTLSGLYQIGTIQRPPQPLLFDKNLRNTPPEDTEGLWSWAYRQWVMYMPEQWYFAE